eukprot:45412-Hanusia_phi.AAC.1
MAAMNAQANLEDNIVVTFASSESLSEMTVLVGDDHECVSQTQDHSSSRSTSAEDFPRVWLDYLVASSHREGNRLQLSLRAARLTVFSHKRLEVLSSRHPFRWFLSVTIFRLALALIALLLLFAPPQDTAIWSLARVGQAQDAA